MRCPTLARAVLAALLVVAAGLVLDVTSAHAQYRPDEVADPGFQARVKAIGADVKRAYPTAWRSAHSASEPQGSEFVRRWALALRASGILACVNGKRGGDTLSQDVLDFPVTSGGAQDTSGPGRRIVIADVIGGAGGPNPSIEFGDVSEFAPGKCIEPFLDASEGAAPGGGGGGDATPPPPPVVSSPTVNLGPVMEAIASLRASVDAAIAELRAQIAERPDRDGVKQAVNEVVLGAEVMGYIRQELAQRPTSADLERLNAWLRTRRALSF